MATNMPGPSNTLLIEGSFEELADELAHYIDEVLKKQTPESANTQAEVTPLLEKNQKDEVLKKLVTGSEVLNNAPEKGLSKPPVAFSGSCILRLRVQNSSQPTTSSSTSCANPPTPTNSSPKSAPIFPNQYGHLQTMDLALPSPF